MAMVIDIFIWSSSKITNFYSTESCRTKKWVEFRQEYIGGIRCSLATAYNDIQRLSQTSLTKKKLFVTNVTNRVG